VLTGHNKFDSTGTKCQNAIVFATQRLNDTEILVCTVAYIFNRAGFPAYPQDLIWPSQVATYQIII